MDIVELSWKETIPVRLEVLWPGMPEDFCYVVGDELASHYGVRVHGELVAVISVFIDEEESIARVRKFATRIEHRHCGYGSALLNHVIAELRNRHIRTLWCISRASTYEYYEKFGLHKDGDPYVRCGVTFCRMSADLGVEHKLSA